MTSKQSFAIFCKTGYDVRGCNYGEGLTQEQIDLIFKNELSPSEISGAILKKKVNNNKSNDWQKLYDEAVKIGIDAGNNVVPEPMIVVDEQADKQWFVSDGMCGFGWVYKIHGNSSFGRWLIKNKYGRKDSYNGGVTISVSAHNQSYTKKMVNAQAMAKFLNENGIKCYAGGRLD